MNSSSIDFHKIWIEQCIATIRIRERYGVQSALEYLIGEKLFNFVMEAERNPIFADELNAFVMEIRRIFSEQEIQVYLDHLEHTKFLAPTDPLLDEDYDAEEELWIDNPITGAEELLRFSRIQQLLQE